MKPQDLFGFTPEEMQLYMLRALEQQLPEDYSTEECEHGLTGYCWDCDDEANEYARDAAGVDELREEDPWDPTQREDDDEEA